jgi:aminoglycoside phosphotransferase family enzyme/predicted kinase
MTHPHLVETMIRPEFYPHRPDHVELIQTHISYIFIAGDYVFKVKKPLDFGFLDFTTLDKREFYCHEELRLNRRLAPKIYLDVVPICEDARGQLVLDNKGRIVEYAVKMLTLPREKMLKTLFQKGNVDHLIMHAVAEKLVDFHRHAATGGAIDEIGSIDTIRRNHDENFEETKTYVNITIPPHQYNFIKSNAHNFIDSHAALLNKRVRDHRIREGHGDLHLEHICIMDPESPEEAREGPVGINTERIIIFDCIEFNERFRYDDVAAEVAFLAMDLDFYGYSDYADTFVHAYIRHSGDSEIGKLLNFYKCYYAYVRGKVFGFKIHEDTVGHNEQEESAKIAARYFELAYMYAARLEKPTLILMAGLTGTGKSVRAKLIADYIGADIIVTDILRKEILNIAPTERHHEEFGKGIYSEEITRKTYERAHERASEKLRNGRSVIIDASYKSRIERQNASKEASRCGADFFILECICPEDIVRKRLDLRLSDTGEASDGRWEIYMAQKESFEAVTEINATSHIILDTSEPPEECVYKAIQRLKKFS